MTGSSLFSRTDRELIENAIRQLTRIADGLSDLAAALEDDPIDPDEPVYIADVKYGTDGVSISIYHPDGSLYDESWHTWSEVDAKKTDDASDFTAELPHPNAADTT